MAEDETLFVLLRQPRIIAIRTCGNLVEHVFSHTSASPHITTLSLSKLRTIRHLRHQSPTSPWQLSHRNLPRPRQTLQLIQPIQRLLQMLLEPRLLTYIAERVLHGHAVRAHHTVRVNMYNVDVVKGLHEVGARDDLPGFVKRNFGEGELVRGGSGGFEVNEGAGEDNCCGLRRVRDM
jgi:hypothetical protein